MKVILAVALVALLVVAGVEAGRNGRHSKDKIKASSKTFVTQAGNVHRFCIPIGKKAAAVTEISLHVPRTSAGFSVKLDTSPARTFASPIGASDKFCDRFSSLFLVKSGVQTPNFLYAQSEIVKDGAIAGYVVGHRPEWIAVRIKGTGITSVPNSDDVCQNILGRKSESADREIRQMRDAEGNVTVVHRRARMVRIVTITSAVLTALLAFALIARCVRRIRARKAAQEASRTESVELGAMAPSSEDQEARDLALAIENSLSDESKKVVEVPQAMQPHFVFLPPNVLPSGASPNAPPAYIPMFAPQFMNYSFEERRDA